MSNDPAETKVDMSKLLKANYINIPQRKFCVTIFCKNDEKFDDYIFNLRYDELIKCTKRHTEEYYEYEYFIVERFKRIPSQNVRGHKCDLVVVEKDLFESEELCKEFEFEIAPIMTVPQRFGLGVQYI